MAVRKWSVSIEEDLASRVEQHVGGRGLSGFVARAVDHELERDALAIYLDELDGRPCARRSGAWNLCGSRLRCSWSDTWGADVDEAIDLELAPRVREGHHDRYPLARIAGHLLASIASTVYAPSLRYSLVKRRSLTLPNGRGCTAELRRCCDRGPGRMAKLKATEVNLPRPKRPGCRKHDPATGASRAQNRRPGRGFR